MNLSIRPFRESDRQPLRELFLVTRDATFVWAVGSHRLEDFDEATAGETIFVACEGERVVGFASVWEADSFLHNLFVHPDAQGRGIGKALLAACAPVFRRRPTLKCQQRNVRALAFYARQGWEIVEQGASEEGDYWLLAGRPEGQR
jgi:GNAT superfamily N-acetyltransferase